MPRHPSHDPDPATYQCRTCGMTNEEQMDYDAIECSDARAAVMPSVVTPIPDHFSERSRKLNELWRRQRGLMIEGLWALARRRAASMERFSRYKATNGEQPTMDKDVTEMRRQALDMAIRCGDPATAVERAGQFLAFLHGAAKAEPVVVSHPAEKRWPKMGDTVIYCGAGFTPAPAIVTHPIWNVDGDGDRKISLYVVGTGGVFPVLSVPRGDWRFRDE